MARVELVRIVGLDREGQMELRRLRKIERAARAVLDGMDKDDVEMSHVLRKTHPGGGGARWVSNARLANLADALS